MIGALARLAGLVLAALLLAGARGPILVPGVSQSEVLVQQGFTGADLTLFGAILTPEGTRAAGDYDVVVVVEGPSQAATLREKGKVAGIWVNTDSTELRSVPAFYSLASTRPIARIVDSKTAAIFEMGLANLQLSPIGQIQPRAQARFAAGLVDLRQRQGLYHEDEKGVKVRGGVLYQALIHLPSSVTVGTYTAETFAIREGRVVASGITRIAVRKQGFEGFVELAARRRALFYGLFAVFVSVAMGWLAGRLFALV